MNQQNTLVTAAPKAVDKPRKPTGKRVSGPNVTGGSRDARRFAAAILEVMAGIRTPTDAAAVLGITMQRYYILEKRALARAAQRTIGLAPPVKPTPQKGNASGKKPRRRRPVVRALKVIDRLQSQPITSDGPTTAGLGPTVTDGQV